MKMIKKSFFVLFLGLITTLNTHANGQSWRDWLRNLGSQAQQQVQKLQSNISHHTPRLQPYQQWSIGAMGTMVPLGLWGSGYLSGRATACMSAASIGSAYFSGQQSSSSASSKQPFKDDVDSQKLFVDIEDNLATIKASIGAQSPPPMIDALHNLEDNLSKFMPYIQDPAYERIAESILSHIENLPELTTFVEVQEKIVPLLEAFVEIMSRVLLRAQ